MKIFIDICLNKSIIKDEAKYWYQNKFFYFDNKNSQQYNDLI
jgi:hypothetical protein